MLLIQQFFVYVIFIIHTPNLPQFPSKNLLFFWALLPKFSELYVFKNSEILDKYGTIFDIARFMPFVSWYRFCCCIQRAIYFFWIAVYLFCFILFAFLVYWHGFTFAVSLYFNALVGDLHQRTVIECCHKIKIS